MIKIDILKPLEMSLNEFFYGVLRSAKITSASSDNITVHDSTNLKSIVFIGSGLSADNSGSVTHGMVTEIDFYSSLGGHLASATGFHLKAVDVAHAVESYQSTGSHSALSAIMSSQAYELNGSSGADAFAGADKADRLNGASGNDVLWGEGGNDTISGGLGNDQLYGGAGQDVLTGGGGADIFIYRSLADSKPGASRDVVSDFSHAEHDRIDLSAIDASTKLVKDQAFTFIGGADFTHHAGELHFQHGVLSGDTNGDGKADFEIAIQGVTHLMSDDFLL